MKNLLYINFDFKNYYNKCTTQLNSFQEIGFQCYLCYMEDKQLKIMHFKDNLYSLVLVKDLNKYNSINIHYFATKFLNEFLQEYNINVIYIRRLMLKSILYYPFIKKVSKFLNVYYEIPTYPFDLHNNFIYDVKQQIEYFFYKYFLNNHIKKTAVIRQNDHGHLRNICEIQNGIDITKYPKPKKEKKDYYEMVGIAHLQNWHGYDRLIKGIYNYSHKEKIRFYIISENTSTVDELKTLVKEYNLEHIVFFKPKMTLEEIIDFTSTSNIAIGSLGYHRRKAKYDTSLKNKEYCALGIPFLYSILDRSFTNDFPFSYKVDNDESDIDIESVLKWYDQLSSNYPNYYLDMYNYAKEKLLVKSFYENLFKEEKI